MDTCCQTTIQSEASIACPSCGKKGKNVPIITLKALLQPSALEIIQPEVSYSFCTNPSCEVVYFSATQSFNKNMLKVPVYQKDPGMGVPVCYCFGWTRERLIQAVQSGQRPLEHIHEQVQVNRCGCEVNNPQGSCCLGNVAVFLRTMSK
jgi:hypothetical protein